MTGRVYKRGAIWYLDWRTGSKKTGDYQRHQRRARGATKAEAQAELVTLLATAHATGHGAPSNAVPLRAVADAWLDHTAMRLNAEVTTQYRRHITRIVEPMLSAGMVTIDRITPQRVEEVMHAMLKTESAYKVNAAVKKLRSALRWAVGRRIIASDPVGTVATLPHTPTKNRRAFLRTEAEALLKSREPWRTYWLFFLSTGLRLDEFVHLQWGDVDLARACIHIRVKKDWRPKTKAGIRMVPLSPAIIAILSAMPHTDPDAPVFATPKGAPRQNNMLRAFRTCLRRSLPDVPDAERKRLDIHALRYTWITELIAAGTDPKTVQVLAGHADISTTLGIYAQCRHDRTVDAIARLPWANDGGMVTNE